MKKLLPILFVLIITSCSKEINLHETVVRKEIRYLVNSSTPINGRVVRYHSNGELQLEVNYVDGKREGTMKIYHPNSQLKGLGNYVNGEKTGIMEYYHSNGEVSRRGMYHRDKKSGVWENFDYKGKLIGKDEYKNGVFLRTIPLY